MPSETPSFIPLEPNTPTHHDVAAKVWTRACGATFALPPRALAYNLRPPLDVTQVGQFAIVDGERVGLVMASVLHNGPDVMPDEYGWIDALVVAPEYQARGIGRALLQWAEDWLRGQGRTLARLGGGLRPFAPGVPLELNVEFFHRHGYAGRAENAIIQDFGLDLLAYQSPAFLRALNVECRPTSERDVDALGQFLAREFPGRWRYEFEQHLRDGARLGDYFVLYSERGLDACCQLTFEDSLRPVERYYPAPLPLSLPSNSTSRQWSFSALRYARLEWSACT